MKTQEEVAVKLEPIKNQLKQLFMEHEIYKRMKKVEGVPAVHHFGIEGDFNCMVMEVLGPSLEDLFKYCHRKFTIKTTCMVAIQLISRIEAVHNCHYIHRDIKPDNFLIGRGKNQILVYVIDFGLAKRYINPQTEEHNPCKQNSNLTGTARYASLNAHKGWEQGRRDDLEAIGIMLVYFLKGSLPWQGLHGRNKSEMIKKLKEELTIDEICHNLPDAFCNFLKYCRRIEFEEKPNYNHCRGFFRDLLNKRGEVLDNYFDWILKKQGKEIPKTDYYDYVDVKKK